MRQRSLVLSLLLSLWVGGAILGLDRQARFDTSPCPTAENPPVIWPKNELAPQAGQSTLVMLAVAGCPCTRASIEELDALLSRQRGRLRAHVLLGPGEQEASASTLACCQAIPGVQTHPDPQGRLARQFGMLSSGQVLIYNPSGRLIYAGGLTGQRGHVGENDALVSAREALEEETCGGLRTGNVYGCPIKGARP